VDALGGRTSGSLFLRAWLYIPSTTQITADTMANATLFVLGEKSSPLGGTSLALWRSGLTLQVNGVQTGSFAVTSSTFPRDAWFCIRMDFPIGGAVSNSAFHVRIGDTALTNRQTVATVSSLLAHPYDRIWTGLNYISDQQLSTVVVYYDDVAVDTKDIACQ
jgi:hypothetical protein